MKKFLSCVVALLIMAISIVPCFAQAPTVSVGASTTSVSVGSVINVYINLSAESNLTMVKFKVNYQTTHFELVSGSAKASKIFSTVEVNESNGYVSYLGANEEDVVAGGTLVSMQFKVLQGGGTISISDLVSTGPEAATSKSLYFKDCAHANMSWEVLSPSTCDKEGKKKGTCACGFTKEETLPKAEHKFDKFEITTEPTCDKEGKQVAICTVCGAKGDTSSVPAKGHTYDEAAIKTHPTCTKPGSAVGKCKICGFESNKPEPIPAKGHNFSNWIVTKEPTLLMEGEESRVCSVCQQVETRKVKKLTSTSDEEVTEPTTSNPIEFPTQSITPIDPETQPSDDNNNNYNPNQNKDDDEEKNGFAGLFGDEMTESDKSAILVVVLAVVTIVVLAIYVILLQQRKKKE